MSEHPFQGTRVVDAPEPMMAPGPSEKQVAFALRLLAERPTYDTAGLSDEEFVALHKSKRDASNLIDRLLATPKSAPAKAEPPEGIHYLDGTVYKVQEAKRGSGRKYAKVLTATEGRGEWEYLGRGTAFYRLSDDTLMTLEDAQEFGKLYGVCCRCGATLTDENSIAAGIGPICASGF